MKLSADTVAELMALQHRAKDLLFAVGQTEARRDVLLRELENRKAALLREFGEVNKATQDLMDKEAGALGIEPGTPWQMMPDGEVVILNPKTGNPLAPLVTP